MEVDLIDYMGNDLTVVNAARVSFDNESDWEYDYEMIDGHVRETGDRKLSARDEKLIKYLATHGHWTPFSHPQVTLRETVPIFVARQRFKHMIGFTYNEVSRRYVSDEPEFYTPDEWRGSPENKKQGSSDKIITHLNNECIYIRATEKFEMGGVGGWILDKTSDLPTLIAEHYDNSLQLYNEMINSGVAPEQARMVLPQSMYTSYYVTGSLAAFARAYTLRSKEDAQKEIQFLAKKWDEILASYFPISWKYLTQNQAQS